MRASTARWLSGAVQDLLRQGWQGSGLTDVAGRGVVLRWELSGSRWRWCPISHKLLVSGLDRMSLWQAGAGQDRPARAGVRVLAEAEPMWASYYPEGTRCRHMSCNLSLQKGSMCKIQKLKHAGSHVPCCSM